MSSQQRFDELDAHALEVYVRKDRRANLPQVTENVIAGCDQTVSARTIRRQLESDIIMWLQCINPSLQR